MEMFFEDNLYSIENSPLNPHEIKQNRKEAETEYMKIYKGLTK